MAGTVMPAPKFIGLDNNANPVSGGKLYTYVAGTTTPQATYSDVNLTVANANPVVLDSAGRATVFLSGSSYKFVLKDSDDVTIWTQDNVQAVAPFSTNLDIQGVAGEAILAGQACYLSDGSGALTAGRWYLADADNAYSSSLPQVAMAPEAIDAGETGTFRLQGVVTKSNAQADFVVGDTYYVSATAGLLSLSPGANVRVMGQADSTTTIVISPNPPNIATTPTFIDGITVTSTDAGAAAAPYLDLYRESPSPAASDQIGEIKFSGEDSAGNKQLYARIYGQIADPTSTSEDGQVRIATMKAGVETTHLVIDETGQVLPDQAGQALGSATKQFADLFLESGAVVNFDNGDVTVTHSANTLTFAGASSGYIFNDGGVGIGMTPTYRLDITGVAGSVVARFNQATAGRTGVIFAENGTQRAFLSQVGLYAGNSDGNFGIFVETGYNFQIATNGSTTAKLTVDTGGNVGIGVTPGSWNSSYKALQIGQSSFMSRTSGDDAYLNANAVYGASNWTYVNSSFASRFEMSSGKHSFFTAPSGTAGNTITWTERFRITSGGDVAIGATAKLYLDGVAGTGDTYIYEIGANNIRVVAGGSNSASFTSTFSEVYGDFYVQAAKKLHLDGGGDTYITESSANTVRGYVGGTFAWQSGSTIWYHQTELSIPAAKKFYVDGGPAASAGDTYLEEYAANEVRLTVGGAAHSAFNATGQFVYYNPPTTASAANAYIAQTDYIRRSTSSIRYKHDIDTLDATDALAAVMAMRPVTYRGKTDEDQRRFVGFIAEEMQEIAPLLCTYDEGGESGTPNYVTYDRVTAYLVAVVQQQQQKIAALEARIH